ncbi:MAG: DUF4864 domain-containing protein [Caldimonas sp.]
MARSLAALCLTLTLALFAAVPAAAAELVGPADAQAVRSVVAAQLDALAADDAERAFSYAAPAIRAQFRTPERFMAMVRAGYPAVYRPATITFLQPVRVEGQLVQGVHLTDAEGALWLAIYRLERQPDKSWRISGCDVRPGSGRLV